MADISNLSQFLTDVATAIREKKGTEEQIPAANFDTEIKSIETSKVKLFTSIDEMNADILSEDGTLAIVYGDAETILQANTSYRKVNCPEQVVLDNVQTNEISVMLGRISSTIQAFSNRM